MSVPVKLLFVKSRLWAAVGLLLEYYAVMFTGVLQALIFAMGHNSLQISPRTLSYLTVSSPVHEKRKFGFFFFSFSSFSSSFFVIITEIGPYCVSQAGL